MQKLMRTMVVILLTALSASLSAAPVAYSINSDSGSAKAEGLYLIDLATGDESRIGTVKPPSGQARIDVEGLAFAADGTLYGVDDESMRLFPLSPESGFIQNDGDVFISGLPSGVNNDFGMTFACDGKLYLTSVFNRSLYQMNLKGQTNLIGSEGATGVRISAIAAYGNPVKLYGLGNGMDQDGNIDSPNLYEINSQTGAATKIGPLGPAAGKYTEGGLAFDDAGQLWAITDRRVLDLPSQVMRINTSTGTASEVKTTTEQGFESLAMTVPRGCLVAGGDEQAEFTVQKRFTDGNDITPVTLNISCNTGLPLEQSLTVMPNEGPLGEFEVKFIVKSFVDGNLNCEVWEDGQTGYSSAYDCQSQTTCNTNDAAGPCRFEGVGTGQNNLCLIQSEVAPVGINVSKQWIYPTEETVVDDSAWIDLYCTNVEGGDGEEIDGTMYWSWNFSPETDNAHTALVQPDFEGNTQCRSQERTQSSAVESENACADWFPVNVGDDPHDCPVINTVFFEGIPTLSQYGLLLLSALMLLTGLFAARRF
jgi:hypothetical protein